MSKYRPLSSCSFSLPFLDLFGRHLQTCFQRLHYLTMTSHLQVQASICGQTDMASEASMHGVSIEPEACSTRMRQAWAHMAVSPKMPKQSISLTRARLMRQPKQRPKSKGWRRTRPPSLWSRDLNLMATCPQQLWVLDRSCLAPEYWMDGHNDRSKTHQHTHTQVISCHSPHFTCILHTTDMAVKSVPGERDFSVFFNWSLCCASLHATVLMSGLRLGFGLAWLHMASPVSPVFQRALLL